MNELWVARDGNNALGVWSRNKPDWLDDIQEWISGRYPSRCEAWLSPMMFPDLLPGECRRLVMESEASE
jgi:hypothetical protein